MKLRITILLCGILALAAIAPAADDETAAKEAVRAHIDRIFKAFINKNRDELRATHAEDWIGYQEGSRSLIKGIEHYMRTAGGGGFADYKMREFDVIVHGDSAYAAFVADLLGPQGQKYTTLRIGDYYTKQNGHWIQTGTNTCVYPEAIQEQMETNGRLSEPLKKSLETARESVWRAFFANDRATLEKLLPEELVVVSGPEGVANRNAIFAQAEASAKNGTKLVSITFPKTEMQVYGRTAILYGTYQLELSRDGKSTKRGGKLTEVFVFRKGQWVNPGWHLAGEQ